MLRLIREVDWVRVTLSQKEEIISEELTLAALHRCQPRTSRFEMRARRFGASDGEIWERNAAGELYCTAPRQDMKRDRFLSLFESKREQEKALLRLVRLGARRSFSTCSPFYSLQRQRSSLDKSIIAALSTPSFLWQHMAEALPLERPADALLRSEVESGSAVSYNFGASSKTHQHIRLDDCRLVRRVILVLPSEHARSNQDALPAEAVGAGNVGSRVVADHVDASVECWARLAV
jgi:hypothetical protein